PGATVKLRVSDGFTPERSVTTGPDGAFSFPGAPAGAFTLEAEDPVTKFKGLSSGTLPEGAAVAHSDIHLEPLVRFTLVVFEPDGLTPATNATVRLRGGNRQ